MSHQAARIRSLETIALDAMAKLNDRQRRFVEAMLVVRCWGCYWRAAEIAGYAWPRSQGPRLMTMPRVRAAHDARLALNSARRMDEYLREHDRRMAEIEGRHRRRRRRRRRVSGTSEGHAREAS